MKKVLPVLAFVGVSCAAVSGPPHADAWGPFSAYTYGLHEMAVRSSAFSVRGGYFVPTGGDVEYEPTWTAGVAYARERERKSIKFVELGVDYAPTQSDEREAELYIARFDVGLGLTGSQWGVYGLAGVHVLYEDSVIILSQKRETWWSPNLNVGGGYRTRRFDLRASYMIMLATDNVPGVFVVGAGVYF